MIKIVDEAYMLSAAEKRRLQNFVRGKCYSYLQDREWLHKVIIRREGHTKYYGYWKARYERVGAHPPQIRAVIVLNATCLLTVGQMGKTLAHEYGHHWTLCYLIHRELLEDLDHPLPMLYYRIRGMDPNDFTPDYSKGWEHCDKEVIAEDYKYLVTSCESLHKMEDIVGLPTAEVRVYLERFGRLHWRR